MYVINLKLYKMYKITEIFKKKKRTLSFEFFPPKTEKGIENLFYVCEELKEYANFFSITYSPDGSSKERTFYIAKEIQKKFKIPVMHHLTCINSNENEIREILERDKKEKIFNILALRGDIRNLNVKKNCYAYQLCKFIKENYDFCVGVACYPEGNLECKNFEDNVRYLKVKIENGADFAITQLFFNNKSYFNYVNEIKKFNENFRIIPGIYVPYDYKRTVEFCERCGANIPEKVQDSINFSIEQCKELLKKGAPGIHFFTLNKLNPVKEVVEKIIYLF